MKYTSNDSLIYSIGFPVCHNYLLFLDKAVSNNILYKPFKPNKLYMLFNYTSISSNSLGLLYLNIDLIAEIADIASLSSAI